MSSLMSVVGALPGYLVSFAAMLLTAAQLAVLFQLVRQRQSAARIVGALLNFLLCFFLLVLLLDYSYNALIEGTPDILHPFEFRLLALPWPLFAVLEVACASVVILYMRFLSRYRRTHLTPDAIRQTVNLLPTGLVISEPDGTVLLANLTMTELCRKLTGQLLSDAGRFWQHVDGFPGWLVRTDDGQAWQFAKSTLVLDGRAYDQVTAANMTERYRVTEELSRMNLHLREVQDRMRAVADKERHLVADREIMNARMTVHNRMGAVLLSGKYYLDHPENVKEDELLRLLEFNNHFLLGQVEQQEGEADPVREAVQLAARIGVDVEIGRALPQSEAARRIIAQAINQCAANAARHAGGDVLRVAVAEDGARVIAAFSNNGSAPAEPIRETGGLAILRTAVEAAGGTMVIQSSPAFLLTITIPLRP